MNLSRICLKRPSGIYEMDSSLLVSLRSLGFPTHEPVKPLAGCPISLGRNNVEYFKPIPSPAGNRAAIEIRGSGECACSRVMQPRS